MSTAASREITVGTKNFPEQYTLGELYAQALRASGFRVTLKANLGATRVLNRALEAGHISVYPEYTGVICTHLATLADEPRTAHATYEAARAWGRTHGNALLAPSAFQTADCLVVRTEFAQQHALSAIGDLRKLAHFSFGAPPPRATRYSGAEGLRRAYGLHNFTFRPSAFGRQYAHLDDHDVDAVAGLATDGQLADGTYRVLTDTNRIFGFQQTVPVVKNSVLAGLPDTFATTLDRVTALLDAGAMIALNKATQLDGVTPRAAARVFLRDHGLLA